jgi:hypothetical protein
MKLVFYALAFANFLNGIEDKSYIHPAGTACGSANIQRLLSRLP